MWCLLAFLTWFQLYRGSQCTYPCFLEFFLPIFRTIYFPSHWQLSHITIVKTMDSGKSELNSVALTIISSRKEYWPSRWSNQRLPFLKSCRLPSEVCSLGDPGSTHVLSVYSSLYDTSLTAKILSVCGIVKRYIDGWVPWSTILSAVTS